MMRTKTNHARSIAAAVGAVALFGVASAQAADVIDQTPVAPLPVEEVPVYTWSGGYVGAYGGYGFSGRTRAPGNSINTDGFQGGAFGGWNVQEGMFVYGAEADIGYNGNEGTNAGLTSQSGVDGTLRARLGVALSDRVLVYGTAGGAAGRLEVSDATTSDTNTMLGWTAGVGTDIKLTDRIFARGEYRYVDYGDKDFSLSGGPTSIDASENKILFGLGMKF
ncbi:outer membrane protein [Nitratireductor sp. StC3]|uniref:outer membrane protein n=1 Tax=Nitratireductor sp. StC3 TaxID=2126741 RepID=UPI00267F4C49